MDRLLGIYRHFKGKNYEVTGRAVDKDIQMKYVLYRQMYEPFEFWIRPQEIFLGMKEIEGKWVQRFVKMSDSYGDIMINQDMTKIGIKHSETKEIYRIVEKKDDLYVVEKIHV